MSRFYDHNLEFTSKGIVSSYSSGDGLDMDKLDEEFKSTVYGGRHNPLIYYSSSLLLIMRNLFSAGKIPNYQFLIEMPEYDAEEWLENAMRKCRRLHRQDEEAFPVGGILDSLDRLRAYRKAQNAAKKKKGLKEVTANAE